MTLLKPVKRRNRWQDKRLRQLERLAAMRAAKERKRLELGPRDEEPRMLRWHRFELGVRDKVTGEVAWVDLKSVRHASKAMGLMLKFC